ncbi:GNAT family N-acetyltransferase [Acetohalobium arabaticum]|uniref:GCN5-related N-acetyltransferase n=1 Tax=Acetohalobium arabaticum (strain ATCC 49924 / DSM 5501 / Z-7288) TaxID=574087 RepID=D9QVA6_ACEAZ|nr:GNAT family N-acetyltransferase [Acetohalobium arabaticum]ADL12165.1 GCN5-related N-acetyltransferase [Acetohalobium arabaticum DSM 5501]
MDYEIRVITEYSQQLLDELIQIEVDAFGRGGLNKWHLVPMINHGRVFVIYNKDKPVGLAEVLRDFEDSELVYLFGLSIRREYRNQGLGSKLLEYILQQLREEGFDKLELTVAPDNQSAYSLYKSKFGFEKEEYRPKEYGRDEPRFVMKVDL